MIKFNICNQEIGDGAKPFLIAEMSGNHNQSLERALAIVDAAAKAGAHALKIQTYTAETMTLNVDNDHFIVSDPKSLWFGESLYKLYNKAATPWEWHKPIFQRARMHGMIPFSTPFDKSSVDFLETLGVDLYKISSFENTDIPLLRNVASTGKPVIMSTGMATLSELSESVKVLRANGCKNLILLKCTSSYPASPEHSNLKTIPHLRDLFGCLVGLSDHTLGIGVAIGAIALGAAVVEKHFTLDRSDGGVDSAFSMEPNEFSALVDEAARVYDAMGSVTYTPTESEKKSLIFRRSIYVIKDINPGEIFTNENIRIIRPGYGLQPKYLDIVLGSVARRSAKRGDPLVWDLLLT